MEDAGVQKRGIPTQIEESDKVFYRICSFRMNL